jgi:hypothetical protein
MPAVSSIRITPGTGALSFSSTVNAPAYGPPIAPKPIPAPTGVWVGPPTYYPPISSNNVPASAIINKPSVPQFLYAGQFQAIANNSTIGFDTSHSQAVLSKPQSLQATLMNFGYGDNIQLLGFHASTVAFSNNHLTLIDAKDNLSESFSLTNGIAVGGTYSTANFLVHDTSFGEVISFVTPPHSH